MHCLDCRRSLLAEPYASSPQLAAHLGECALCRAFAASLLRDEETLRAALAVPLPEQLHEKILLRTALRRRRDGWFERLRGMLAGLTPHQEGLAAIAGAAVLVAGVWFAGPRPIQSVDWSRVALEHTVAEIGALASTKRIPQARLEQELARYGMALDGELGVVRFLEHCPLPGGKGVHVVIETPDLGQVTLILPPPGTDSDEGTASAQGFSARMVSTRGATVAVVTRDSARLPALAARMQQRLVARIG
jgi:hypothetical protein